MKYSHSDNEELYYGQFDTHEEALADALREYSDSDTDFIYIAEAHQYTIGHYLNAYQIESLLESMSEQAGVECDEAADEWLAPPNICRMNKDETSSNYKARIDAWHTDRKKSLSFLLDAFRGVLETWATNNGKQPTFWHVKNSHCYDMSGVLVNK